MGNEGGNSWNVFAKEEPRFCGVEKMTIFARFFNGHLWPENLISCVRLLSFRNKIIKIFQICYLNSNVSKKIHRKFRYEMQSPNLMTEKILWNMEKFTTRTETWKQLNIYFEAYFFHFLGNKMWFFFVEMAHECNSSTTCWSKRKG